MISYSGHILSSPQLYIPEFLAPFEARLFKENIYYVSTVSKIKVNKKLMNVDIGYLSIRGKVRERDEDSLLVLTGEVVTEGNLRQRFICAVADGMGGGEYGEVASNIATEKIGRESIEILSNRKMEDGEVSRLLESSLSKANEEIFLSSKKMGVSWMGTTVTVAALVNGKLHVFNIGDSRTYIIKQNGEIKFRTKDNSYVQELVDSHQITEGQARRDPRRNELTRALGIENEVLVDRYILELEAGDSVMLCCDGLWEAFNEDEEIGTILTREKTAQDAVDALVEEANERDGSDNISAIIIKHVTDLQISRRQ